MRKIRKNALENNSDEEFAKYSKVIQKFSKTLKLEENELIRQRQLRSYEIDENTHFSGDNGETNMPSEDLIPISM